MIASGASNSPTGRWKGRLHREHASPEFYISKRTFDTLRAASEDFRRDSIQGSGGPSQIGWKGLRYRNLVP